MEVLLQVGVIYAQVIMKIWMSNYKPGCETWTIEKSERKRLEAAENNDETLMDREED